MANCCGDEENFSDAYSAYAVGTPNNDNEDTSASSTDLDPNILTAIVTVRPVDFEEKPNSRKNICIFMLIIVSLSSIVLSLTYVFVWNKSYDRGAESGGHGNYGLGEDFLIHERPQGFETLRYSNFLQSVIVSEYKRRGDAINAAMLDQLDTPQRLALEWLTYEDSTVLTKRRQIVQRFALLVIYFSTGGASLWDREWLIPGVHECHFDGVECEEALEDLHYTEMTSFKSSSEYEDLQVISLDLAARSLVGDIPRVITMLTNLRKLNLANNRLKGPVPEELYLQENLVELQLGANSIIGTISSNFHKLSTLEKFSIHSNLLTGSLPTTIPRRLKHFDVRSNDLSGPFELFARDMDTKSQSYLEHFDMSSNSNIGGSIPTEIGLFTSLTTLRLAVSNIRGTLPSEVGLLPLKNAGLNVIKLQGTLPVEFWKIPTLKAVFADDSIDLEGSIPTEIGLMQKLQLLSMASTNISGTIPTEIGLVSSLLWLNAPNTRLSGMIPSEMGNLPALEEINLASTNLQGTVPPEVCPSQFLMTCKNDTPVKCDCCTTCFEEGKGFFQV